ATGPGDRLLGRDAAVLVHVGDVVRVLVPDLPGRAPALVPVDLDALARTRPGGARVGLAGRADHAGVRRGDDLGVPVAVHVGDRRLLGHGPRGARRRASDGAGLAVVDAHPALVAIDELGGAVAVEVECHAVGRAGRLILRRRLPQDARGHAFGRR